MKILIKTVSQTDEHNIRPRDAILVTPVGDVRPLLKITYSKKGEIEITVNPWRWSDQWDEQAQQKAKDLTNILKATL